jgi:ergothioneine biosynthesis protein EgtB
VKAQPATYGPSGRFDPPALAKRFAAVRARTLALAAPLTAEDACAQSMPDASPAKWHLAHTAWFFETFLLLPYKAGARAFDPAFNFLFNSYYDAAGHRHARPQRGMLTRPTLGEVRAYRQAVDEAMLALLAAGERHNKWGEIASLTELGCQHEQQHQELLLTDIKHLFSMSPLKPAYAKAPAASNRHAPKLAFVPFKEGLYEVGADGTDTFAFDCEGPRHKVYLYPFALASRLAANGEFAAFIDDKGYERPELWLADGFEWAAREQRRHPLYWRKVNGGYNEFTLTGERALNAAEPVCHLSHYEADAFARWSGCRLPREEEIEVASVGGAASGPERFHPDIAPDAPGLSQTMGAAWTWTSSGFSPYPGFRARAGAVGEYNGKFMANQMVVKGGSVATPPGHARASYRNFFYPPAQWQFTGVRLARDA